MEDRGYDDTGLRCPVDNVHDDPEYHAQVGNGCHREDVAPNQDLSVLIHHALVHIALHIIAKAVVRDATCSCVDTHDDKDRAYDGLGRFAWLLHLHPHCWCHLLVRETDEHHGDHCTDDRQVF